MLVGLMMTLGIFTQTIQSVEITAVEVDIVPAIVVNMGVMANRENSMGTG
jgi:hypothetical protein